MTKETALITGGSIGIGLELAKVFAKNGHPLVIVARDQQELDTAASELKLLSTADVITIQKDLFNPESAEELYEQIKKEHLSIGILVNNAGQGQYGEFSDSNLQRQLDIIQLNVCSVVSLTHFFVRDFLVQGRGKILNVSSVASKSPGPWQVVYHATKAFVQSFTEGLRSEVKDKGITVTALLPGATRTDFFNKAGMHASKIVQDKDKMADPADVAQDGYAALMNNEDMVVSGFGNKAQIIMASVTPDEQLADMTKRKQEPVQKGTRL